VDQNEQHRFDLRELMIATILSDMKGHPYGWSRQSFDVATVDACFSIGNIRRWPPQSQFMWTVINVISAGVSTMPFNAVAIRRAETIYIEIS
jgi:hypothetical protein